MNSTTINVYKSNVQKHKIYFILGIEGKGMKEGYPFLFS